MKIVLLTKMSCLWISFILTIIVITVGKLYRTIVCIYIVCLGAKDGKFWNTNVDDAMFSISCVGRLLEDVIGWRWRMAIEQNLTFLNVIMPTIMVLMLGTYQIHFIWNYIFSIGAKYVKYEIVDATLCSGSIEFVFVDCASIFVSGARPLSHNIAKYV